MSDNVVFSVLSNHFFNYTKRYQPDIELFEIEDFLIEWLPRIQVHIPEQSGHRFRHYPDSHSAINRTLILR